MSYDFFKSEAKSLVALHLKYDSMLEKHKELNKNKQAFDLAIGDNHSKFTWLGVLCAVALAFDFFVNTATLHWMPKMLGTKAPVQLFAIIFLLLDAIIATKQAGAFENTAIEKERSKKKWRPILWSFAGIKAILFVIFTHVVKVGSFEGGNIMTAVQLAFLIIIYAILDRAGEGIYYLVQWLKFKFLEEIWYDKPEEIASKANQIYNKIDAKCPQFQLNFEDFLNYFKLTGRITKISREN